MESRKERMKQCSRCKTVLPATADYFNRVAACKSGLHCWCKACSRAAQARFRRKHPDKILEYRERAYTTGKARQTSAAWTKANREKKHTNYATWLSSKPLYYVHRGIKARCLDEKHHAYAYYGGANPPVRVCKRWLGKNGYKNFVKDVGARPSAFHTLGRFGDVGDYKPSNVKWMNRMEQGEQRRQKNALKKQ